MTGRLARWRLRLSRFDFNIVYHIDIKYRATDALSRLIATSEHQALIKNALAVAAVEFSTGDYPNISFKKNIFIPSDEVDKRTVTLVGEDNDAEKEGAFSGLQVLPKHYSIGAFCKKCCAKPEIARPRVYFCHEWTDSTGSIYC